MKKAKKYVTKSTFCNVLAGIFLVLFILAVVANAILIKFDILKELYVKTFPSVYLTEQLADGFQMPADLIAIGIALGALLLLLLPKAFSKHGKGWNLFPFLLILADTVYFVLEVFFSDIEVADFSNFLGRSFLQKPDDINLFVHVIVFMFLAFALARGTKKIPVSPETAENVEPATTYRNVTLTRKISPFGRNQEFDCWLNGDNLASIADGQEKTFLVDQYGAEIVVVAQSGEESNIISVPEGKKDAHFLLTTSRNQSGNLLLTLKEV